MSIELSESFLRKFQIHYEEVHRCGETSQHIMQVEAHTADTAMTMFYWRHTVPVDVVSQTIIGVDQLRA